MSSNRKGREDSERERAREDNCVDSSLSICRRHLTLHIILVICFSSHVLLIIRSCRAFPARRRRLEEFSRKISNITDVHTHTEPERENSALQIYNRISNHIMLSNRRQRQSRSVLLTSKIQDMFKPSTPGTLSPMTTATTSSGYSTGDSSVSTAAVPSLKKSPSSSIGLKQQQQQQQHRTKSKGKQKTSEEKNKTHLVREKLAMLKLFRWHFCR